MTRKRTQPSARPADELYEVDTGDWKFEEPIIDPRMCVECGRCHVFCPTNSVTHADGHYEINEEWCKGCGICVTVCPSEAIEMREVNDETVIAEYDKALGTEGSDDS